MQRRLEKALDLVKATDTQRAAIKPIIQQLATDLKSIHKQHGQLHKAMLDAFAATTLDAAWHRESARPGFRSHGPGIKDHHHGAGAGRKHPDRRSTPDLDPADAQPWRPSAPRVVTPQATKTRYHTGRGRGHPAGRAHHANPRSSDRRRCPPGRNAGGYLRTHGYQVDCCGDGESGLQAQRRTGYDAVVLDVMLPGIDGLEVCRRMPRLLPGSHRDAHRARR